MQSQPTVKKPNIFWILIIKIFIAIYPVVADELALVWICGASGRTCVGAVGVCVVVVGASLQIVQASSLSSIPEGREKKQKTAVG